MLAVVAVLAHRPDVLVIAGPLLVIAGWSALSCPSDPVVVEQDVSPLAVHEGTTVSWRVHLLAGAGAEQAAVVQPGAPWVSPGSGVGRRLVDLAATPSGATVDVPLDLMRWGRHRVQPALVVTTGAWAAFRWISPRRAGDARTVHSLPALTHLRRRSAALRAPGLAGVEVSPREGSGTEFASVRPFRIGDRRSRINWRRTQRTGVLHVDATWADHDRHVEIVVDATEDVGASTGVHDSASSLDLTVRAAASVAAAHLRLGDRVGLTVLGSLGTRRVNPGSGRPQLRRLLHALATVDPAPDFTPTGRPAGIDPTTTVVVTSPLLTAKVVDRIVAIAAGGAAVVAVDCLPPDIALHTPDEPLSEVAWRVERLRRRRLLARLHDVGVSVVPWDGPGTEIAAPCHPTGSGRTTHPRPA